MKDIEGMTVDQLLAENVRLLAAMSRTYDTFATFLLSGQQKMVMREIENRHLNAAKAERI